MSNQHTTASLVERFQANVRRTESCWLWVGSCCGKGYGTIRNQGRQLGAHRLSWMLHRGAIPHGMFVLHRCDVPSCVNPDHLFLGTHVVNMADMKSKQRQASGSRQGSAKLSEEDVRAILNDRRSQVVIAAQYGIGQTQVSKIKRRQRWSGVVHQ